MKRASWGGPPISMEKKTRGEGRIPKVRPGSSYASPFRGGRSTPRWSARRLHGENPRSAGAGGVERLHLVAVGGARREAGVHPGGGPSGKRHHHGGRAPGAQAPHHSEARLIGGGVRPAERDLSRPGGGPQTGRRRGCG